MIVFKSFEKLKVQLQNEKKNRKPEKKKKKPENPKKILKKD